jgi:hypothetical protein
VTGAGRNEQAEDAVDAPQVPELVGVGEVLTVPGQEEVASVVRGEGEVQGAGQGILSTTSRRASL